MHAEVRQLAVDPAATMRRLQQAIATVIRGKEDTVRLLLTALFAGGHVLVEDVPGVGKTTLARALAACLGGSFRRIQFTSDLLPSDIVGVTIYRQDTHTFEFKQGPIFANFILADEINRTTPRTQSALMEVLSEGQVTVDTQTHALEQPFMLIATQNPVEHFGTYPLPESQMDRFLLRLEMGYPAPDEERRVILERQGTDPLRDLEPVVTLDHVRALQRSVDRVRVDRSLLDYLMAIVEETRQSPLLSLGVSTRGALAWYRAAQAYAMVHGRDYCVPDDIKALARPALVHRFVLSQQRESLMRGRQDAEQILADILERVPVPL